jgi:glycosyltransferase involved in cell wall biosynthesis
MMNMEKTKVSIVIIAKNEEDSIARCIKSVKKQNYKNKEIIVVDDESTDRTGEISRKTGAKVVRNKNNLGIARSFNVGIKASKGDIIITFHADAEMIGKDWIKNIVKTLSQKGVGAVTGNRVPRFLKKPNPVEKVHLYFGGGYIASAPTETSEINWLPTRCDAFKREALEEVGYFNSRLRVSGDCIDITTKLKNKGYKLLIEPKCKTRINLSAQQNTLKKIMKKRIDFGKVIPYLLVKYKFLIIKNTSWFLTSVPYMAYFLFLILSIFHPLFLFLFLLENLVLSLRIAKVTGADSFFAAFLLIPIYTIVWNIGIIYGLFLINKKII